MKLTIGVMGASGGDFPQGVRERACQLGEAVAERDAVLITGGGPGLPYEAVLGAKAKGGLVVGISPGLSLDEHRGKYRSPVDGFDVLVYTGSGLMGRDSAIPSWMAFPCSRPRWGGSVPGLLAGAFRKNSLFRVLRAIGPGHAQCNRMSSS